jgi:hypothetical protein
VRSAAFCCYRSTLSRAEIKAFDMKSVPEGGYDFKTSGQVFAFGVRDTLEFVEDANGVFWNVSNQISALFFLTS